LTASTNSPHLIATTNISSSLKQQYEAMLEKFNIIHATTATKKKFKKKKKKNIFQKINKKLT